MTIQKVSGKILGYDPEQVDGLLDRVRRQYDNPQSRLVTPGMLAVAKFDLVRGGYRIDQVDTAIAKVADEFEVKEIAERIAKFGKAEIKRDLRKIIGMVAETLATAAKERFSPSPSGYHHRQVDRLISKVRIAEGKIFGPEPLGIRTSELGTAKGGPNRSEVNEFLALVVSAMHTQRLLG